MGKTKECDLTREPDPVIRAAQPADYPAIGRVNELAFGHPKHYALLDALRTNGRVLFELVACLTGDVVVGHVLFTALTIHSASSSSLESAALGPLAVLPEDQWRGIGSALVKAGVEECRRLGYDAVFLLGHPTYYPRFGFVPARDLGIIFEDGRDSFQVLVLREGALPGVRGTAHFVPEFDSV
jgi:putative acetyltransferase